MAKNMKKTYKNQRVAESYPQENEKIDIFFTDNPLFFINKSDLSTDLSTGVKNRGVGVQFLHPPLVQKLHPNNLKFFNNNTRAKKRGSFFKVIHRLKFLLFSRKKGGDFMTIDELQQLNDLLTTFLNECETISREKGDTIEKHKFINGYEIFMICKRRI